jgi:hypothetical protein
MVAQAHSLSTNTFRANDEHSILVHQTRPPTSAQGQCMYVLGKSGLRCYCLYVKLRTGNFYVCNHVLERDLEVARESAHISRSTAHVKADHRSRSRITVCSQSAANEATGGPRKNCAKTGESRWSG